MLTLKQSVGIKCPNTKDDVIIVQGLLNQAQPRPNPPLTVDGNAGQKTFNALTTFIENDLRMCIVAGVRLEPGSVYWKKLLKPTELPASRGGTKLSENDFITAAKEINCEVACIKAVNDVESGRHGGYFSSGRPVILFEAHIFSKLTAHKYDKSLPDISSRKWNKNLYAGGEAEYGRLEKAMAFDRTAALKSASWGRFQIMGFNFTACGYKSVDDFTTAMYLSEYKQLNAFLSFVRTSNLDKKLRDKDWAAFAYGYNGPEYSQNAYDQKLKAAYNKYAKKP